LEQVVLELMFLALKALLQIPVIAQYFLPLHLLVAVLEVLVQRHQALVLPGGLVVAAILLAPVLVEEPQVMLAIPLVNLLLEAMALQQWLIKDLLVEVDFLELELVLVGVEPPLRVALQ
jgi:hypothetical protein